MSDAAYRYTREILRLPDMDGWQIYGKTGWFVGWASKGAHTLVFISNLDDEAPHAAFASQRAKAILLEKLPALLQQASH